MEVSLRKKAGFSVTTTIHGQGRHREVQISPRIWCSGHQMEMDGRLYAERSSPMSAYQVHPFVF